MFGPLFPSMGGKARGIAVDQETMALSFSRDRTHIWIDNRTEGLEELGHIMAAVSWSAVVMVGSLDLRVLGLFLAWGREADVTLRKTSPTSIPNE
jgi:hypothetical protein